MAERRSFDMASISTASKILLIAGFLYFIDLFLAWQKVCINFGGVIGERCGSANGWDGIGILNGILVILILVMEILLLLKVEMNVGTPQMRNQVEAGLAGGVLLFTILKVIIDNEAISWPAWLGLILAVVIAYGGWMRWQESSAAAPPPAPGGGYAP